MRTSYKYYFICVLFLFACKQESKKTIPTNLPEPDPVVEILTQAMDFQAPDTIRSGWQHIRYKNASPETHFVIFEKYPEGKDITDAEKEVVPPFQEGMEHILAGEQDSAMVAFGKLPTWFSEIVFMGGTGMIGPGRVAESTVYLEPGYYVMECYVKMPDGTFHSAMGMIEPIIVVSDSTSLEPAAPDVTLEIGMDSGIVIKDSIIRGQNSFRVNFRDQKPHEHFIGHDINLARLTEEASLDSLVSWMDWSQPEGLSTPVPEGVIFLGGMNDLPAGKHGYFRVNLEPGRYVLISEVPNALEKGMLREFRVE